MPKSLIPTTPAEPASVPEVPSVPSPEPLAVATLDTAQPLPEIFQPFQVTLDTWKAKAASLVVTNLSQKTEMQQARLARLELKEARVSLEKKRKGLVEHLKARTGKIDATARAIREEMELLEHQLLLSEQFAERHAAQLKAETKLLREQELAPFMDTPILGDLSDLSVADYATLLNNTKLVRAAKLEAAVKAEQEAAAKAKAEQEERARIAAENERLKLEAAQAREAEAQRARAAAAEMKRIADAAEAERQRVEATVRAEQARLAAQAKAERERLQREHEAEQAAARQQAAAAQAEAQKAREELRRKQEAEAAEKRKAEAERKASEKAVKAAAVAPDRDKIKAYAIALGAIARPALSNPAAANKLDRVLSVFNRTLLTLLDDQLL